MQEKNKNTLLSAAGVLLPLLVAVAALIFAINLSTQVRQEIVPTAIARQFPTLVAELGLEGLAARPTPLTPVPTKTPTITPTKPTATFAPPVTPTATPLETEGHDPAVWHDYSEFGHGHGMNPFECDTRLNGLVQKHIDDYGGMFGYPWQTADENENHHNGYFLFCIAANPEKVDGQHTDGCLLHDQEGSPLPEGANCISVALLLLHSDGSGPHARKPIHSQTVWAVICDQALSQCDTHYQGGRSNYGQYQTSYKNQQCWASPFRPTYVDSATGETVYYPDSMILLPPLHFTTGNERSEEAVEYWQSQRVATNSEFYPGDPNYSLQLAWAIQNAQTFVPNNQLTCADPTFDIPSGTPGDIVRVITVLIPLDKFPQDRPLSIWIDNFGHPNPACLEAGPIADTEIVCSPFFLGSNVPANGVGAYLQHRGRGCGEPDSAPCIDLNPDSFPVSTATPPP